MHPRFSTCLNRQFAALLLAIQFCSPVVAVENGLHEAHKAYKTFLTKQTHLAPTFAEPGSGPSTCGLDKSARVPNCDKEDMGSCGNACCALEVPLKVLPTVAYENLKSFLQSGGDSDAFAYVPGAMPHNEHPADDIRQADIPYKFIVQGTHNSSGRHYIDTLDFTISNSSDSKLPSVLRAFSISDLHGALGDAGQNYKTISYVLSALGADVSSGQVIYGCSSAPKWKLTLPPRQSGKPTGDTSNCGLNGDTPADCGRNDKGSCGNACCALETSIGKPSEEVHSMVKKFLEGGGDSGAYAYTDGKMPHNEHPADDLRKFGMKYKFIMQGTHTTSGRHYKDTLNFNIREGNNASSVILRAFSISDLHGSLGDAGQNFKTLSYMLDAIGVERRGVEILHGCGTPTKAEAVSEHSAATTATQLPLQKLLFSGLLAILGLAATSWGL